MITPAQTLGEVSEEGLLGSIFPFFAAQPGTVVGPGDDAAVLTCSGQVVATTDSMVRGRDWLDEWSSAADVGAKLLTQNLADVAAMGGTPRHATVSLSLPPATPFAFVEGLYDGLLERAAETSVNLVGGNVAAAGNSVVVDVTLLGQAERLIRRSGAEPGDRILVTGTLGASAAGLLLLAQGVRLDEDGALTSTGFWTESSSGPLLRCLQAHLDPHPPIALGRALGETEIAHAAIDVSDGLSGDLLHICEASGLAAWIDPAALPVDPDAAVVARAGGRDATEMALGGGEDYQLLLAIAPSRVAELQELALVWGVSLSEIGEFEAGEPVVSLRKADGREPLRVAAHDHFRAAESGDEAGPQ
jgi:thiamine-monophosphate kinase